MNILICHLIAFVAGFILDLILGDPRGLVHPVQVIGALISKLDKGLYTGNEKKDFKRGILLVLVVTLTTFVVTGAILLLCYYLHFILGIVVEAVFTWWVLAIKSLKTESMKVYYALNTGDIDRARFAVSMIVGRDTSVLDEAGVTRAAVETVAENTSDGIIAPMFYTALGGPLLGMLYKSINTMDSMIGYKNDRYMYLGRAAARLDDVVNFIPARLGARFMILSSYLGGKSYNGHDAHAIYLRDRNKSKSPNASKCESVCAGALGIRLLGPCVYFGKTVFKEYIGDEKRKIEPLDIKRTNKLMFLTSLFFEIFCILLILGGILIWYMGEISTATM